MKSEIIAKLQQFFSTQPIEKAWLFGSYARGEETPDSDVDILVTFVKNARISLFKHAKMIASLEILLNKRVDLVPEKGLAAFALDSVNNDKIIIYERDIERP